MDHAARSEVLKIGLLPGHIDSSGRSGSRSGPRTLRWKPWRSVEEQAALALGYLARQAGRRRLPRGGWRGW